MFDTVKRKLRWKMLIIFIISGLIPLAVSFLLLYNQGKTKLEDRLIQSTKVSASSLNQEIDYIYNKLISIENTFYYNQELLKLLRYETTLYQRTVEFNKIFNDAFLLEPDLSTFIDITIIHSDGQIISSWSKNFIDYSYLFSHPVVKDTIAKSDFLLNYGIGTSFYDPNVKELIIAQSYTENDKYLFTIVVGLDMEYISNRLYSYFNTDKDFILFTDMNRGEILFQINSDLDEFPDGEVRQSNRFAVVNSKKYLHLPDVPSGNMFQNSQASINADFFTAYDDIDTILGALSISLIISFLIVLISYSIFIIIFSIYIIRPIRALSIEMNKFKIDSSVVSLPSECRIDEIGVLAQNFRKLSQQVQSLYSDLKTESRKKEQYYFQSIRAQVRPHFLFNTLTMIKWMAIMKKEDDIYHSIDNLAGILQYTMNKNGEMIKLEEELNIIEKYMELQNLRTGGRFTYTTNFSPEVLDCSIIKFIIQPIVENCVLHAFGERKTDCIICITAEINGDKLLLRVIDNGIGMGSEQLNRFFSSKTSNVDIQEHLGLSTIDERIRLQFGNSFGLSIDSDEGGTTILYLLPLIRD